MKQAEEKIQAECIRWFRMQYKALEWSLFAIPNGGQRNVIVAKKLKEGGALSGVWDLFLSVPKKGHSGMFIEMKAGKNKLTDNQLAFREANKENYAFEVCYTTSAFINAVNNYLK